MFDDHWIVAKWSAGHDAIGEWIGVGGEGGSGDQEDRETDECSHGLFFSGARG